MNATEDKTYNGWTNYETWIVNLWIENDIDTLQYWQAESQQVWNDSQPTEFLSREESAKIELAGMLKEWAEENTPETSGMYADLLNGALSEVNWMEIAGHKIEAAQQD